MPPGESFHPDADRTTPMERLKYAGMAAAAVTSLGLGYKWRADKATTNEQPGTRKSQSLESAAIPELPPSGIPHYLARPNIPRS